MAINIIGEIDPLIAIPGYSKISGTMKTGEQGLAAFFSNLIILLIIIAGLFSIVNFIIAGYLYLGSNGNPQQLQAAGNKILQSLIGLIIIAAAFVIAGLIGYLLFQDATFLFTLKFGGFE